MCGDVVMQESQQDVKSNQLTSRIKLAFLTAFAASSIGNIGGIFLENKYHVVNKIAEFKAKDDKSPKSSFFNLDKK